jgi:hypothetical protein
MMIDNSMMGNSFLTNFLNDTALIQYPSRKTVCLVVGPYKTATSLVTKLIEEQGYSNPSMTDNIYETAVGLSTDRYKTRESTIVREINIRLLNEEGSGLAGTTSFRTNYFKKSTFLDMVEFLTLQPNRTVIKDPLLCWTLPVWIQACALYGSTPKVFFTSRIQNLSVAWGNAPFTKMLMRDCNGIIGRMTDTIVQNKKYLRATNTAFMEIEQSNLMRNILLTAK